VQTYTTERPNSIPFITTMDASSNMSGMSMSMDTTNDQSLSFAPHSNPPTPHRFSNVKPSNLPWNVEEARSTLRNATVILSNRGLKMASRWAAEQLNSLAPLPSNDHETRGNANANVNHNHNHNHDVSGHSTIASSNLQTNGNDLEMYAKSIMDLGEYQRAASILSANPDGLNNNSNESGLLPTGKKRIGTKGGDLIINPPLDTLTSYGVYLRAYALYMAGERRKEEEVLELR
jgi:anaphase-promoting complex subunit 8